MFNKAISRRSFLTVSALTAVVLTLDWKKINAYAARINPKENFPVVVIGAGLGGLCCGAYLARQGIPVTVVEQHSVPGGYASSFDRGAGKYTFEVSLHGTSINKNAPARILNDIGVLDKIELAELPEVYRLKTPGLDISVSQKDPEAYIRLLSRHFPAEADGIRGFVQEMLAIAEEVEKLHKKRGKFFKPLFPIQYRKMWNVRHKTLADLMADHVKDPELQNVLSALWGYYGLPPSLLSGFYYANATGGYLKNGSYYIKRRSQNLSDAIAEVIKNHGGRLIYDTRVEEVLLNANAVKGVVLEDGQTLPAAAVVSNASALATFREMLAKEALPDDYHKRLEGYKPSLSCFIVWLGLNRDVRSKTEAFSTFLSSGLGPEADYQSKLKGDVENGSFGVAIYDNIYEGYSSPGTSTLQLIFMCGYEPWRKFESDYRSGQKTQYNLEKARWADVLIRRAEKELLPGLSTMIEVKEAATPLTNWRYTGNTEGAIYGFEQSMNNAFMDRIENRTPVKGLYLASAWGNPGGGYAGVLRGGQLAFKAVMEDLG